MEIYEVKYLILQVEESIIFVRIHKFFYLLELRLIGFCVQSNLTIKYKITNYYKELQ